MNKLPKYFNKWIVLLVIVVISLIATLVVTNNKSTDTVAPTTQPVTKNVDTVKPTVNSPVSVKLNYDYTAGFVDVLITNPSLVEHGELLFKLNGNTKYTKMEEDTLFEKYFTSNETDKTTGVRSLRVGASKGIEGSAVQAGQDQKFARIYFSSLSENNVTLDVENSSFFVGTGNPVYKVVVTK